MADLVHKLPRTNPEGGGKNILIYNWRDVRHSYAGGAEVYVHELAKRWVADGHQVTLFCGNDGKCTRRETIEGVHIVRRGGFFLVYFWAFAYYLVRFRGRYDIIIDCHNGIPFFTPCYAKEPVIGVVHHIHQEVFRQHLAPPLAMLASFLEYRLMPWVYRHVRFIAVSQSTKQEMLQLGIGTAGVEIVHNGVDLAKLQPGPKSLRPLVVYLGRLKAYKSVNVLLQAFRHVQRELPEAKLVVAGSGEEEAELKRLAMRLGINHAVDFRGRVTDAEKNLLLQRAWVVSNPSMVEGWGLTTIEANASGTPVVGANVAGLRDSIKNPHTGYLAPHGDPDAFADRIHELLTDHELRDEMSSNAVEWANNFTWENSSERAQAIFMEHI